MTDAERYVDNHGWMGTSKKHVGVCRLFSEGDIPLIRVKEAVIGVRPRGILSGFLVIVPESKGTATFIHNTLTNKESYSFRLRLCEELRKTGCIASAYMNKDEIVVEDMLVWKDEPVFYCKTFPERWSYVQQFFSALATDSALQRCTIRAATYALPTTVTAVPNHSVVEWVPFAPNQRRLVVVPDRTLEVKPVEKAVIEKVVKKVLKDEPVVARRDAVGPDVYQLWRGSTHLGQALVRTMGVSKSLRLCPGESIPVKVEFHKVFSKWEIVSTIP